MNKITLGFFLAKSKTTIKGLLALFVFLLMNTQASWGQGTLSSPIFSENFGTLANATALTTSNTTFSFIRVGTSTTANTIVNRIIANNPSTFIDSSALIGAKGGSISTVDKTGLTSFSNGVMTFKFKTPSSLNSAILFSAVGSGASFGSINGFTGAQLSSAFQVNGTNLQIRAAGAWTTVQTVAVSTTYTVTIVFNNTVGSLTYGDAKTLASNKCHLWVNSAYVGEYSTATSGLAATAFRIYATTSEFEVDDVAVYNTLPAASSTWTTSWSNGTPDATKEAIIDGTYNTNVGGVQGPFTAKKLTVNASKSLTINTGTNVTVQNEVINNGSLVVENNANLIQGAATTTNSNVGAITVKRNSNALNRLDYTMWSSPVSDGTQTLLGFSPLTSQLPTSRFYIYDNTQGTTGLYSSVSPTTPFATGTGYLIRMPNEDPSKLGTSSTYYLGTSTLTYNGVFTGVPNNGDVTLNVTSGTYNGVGNPYPSTINADLFLSDNSITSGTDALYFWRKSNNSAATSYATYTTAGGTANSGDPLSITPDATIQVGQGFIAKSTSATLKFTNSMRTANNGNKILKTKLIERNRIWLNLSNETTPISQMMVAYMTGATQGIDPTIDGSYINDSETALNSLISNKEYVIQGRSLPFDGTDVVPLAFKTATAGKFTIAIDHTDGLFATAQDVYLVDNATGSETDLKAGSYTFDAAAGVDNARFSLKYQKTLKVDAPVFNDNSVSVYKNNGTLYVNSGAVAIANIKVFDIQGRLIAEQKNVKSNTGTISNLKATQQVLIVQVTAEDKKVVNKKVVN